jgi:putative tryptophan/tyrosine transport system substrate-binding protein
MQFNLKSEIFNLKIPRGSDMIGHPALLSVPSRSARVLAFTAWLVLGCGGKPAAKAPAADSVQAAGGAKPPLVALVRAADWMGHEWSEDAIKLGLEEADMEAGRDYELSISSAQGDLATLPSLLDKAVDSKAKVIVALQDATLQVAVQRVKTVPVVFHLLADPFAAGAGTSDSNHLPNITGVYSPGFGDPEQTRRVDLIKRMLPKARKLGILFSPDDQLSVIFKDRTTTAAQKGGLTVVAVPVNNVGEIGDATRSLCSQKVDAIELFGNVSHAAFPGLIKVAKECHIPVFSPSPFEVMQGALASLFPDFQEGGVMAGKMIARILHGENPANIPFYQVKTTKLAVNAGSGVPVPPDVVKQADTVVGGAPKQ